MRVRWWIERTVGLLRYGIDPTDASSHRDRILANTSNFLSRNHKIRAKVACNTRAHGWR